MAASSSSSIPPPQWEYDVFLGFRGFDTRKNIISHLRDALKRNGFRTFRDDENLDRGESIAPGLLEAIENSSMSLVVFSKDYFASTWCLTELKKIMECHKDLQHIVLPVFYEIEPSHIRELGGKVAKSLANHEVLKMVNWSATLNEVASLAGFVSNNYRDEASLVDAIVEEVQGKLGPRIHLNVATYTVGIDPRLQKLLNLLCLESSDDVRIIAIWGIGGLGKTTIAKAAFNHIRSRFEACSFVANVRETWEQSRVVDLQNQIRFDISKNKTGKIRNFHEGVEFLKFRVFYGKKVLLVLDDVDHVEQLNALAINPSFFHPGSRIIVTTRNISSLNSVKREVSKHELVQLNKDESLRDHVNKDESFQDHVKQMNALTINPSFLHRGSRLIGTTRDISSLNSVKWVLSKYELEQLNKVESLQLFKLHAFNEHNPPEGFMELSNTVVDYAGGIPLVLEVLGSFLNGINDQSKWGRAIEELKKIPHDDVQRKLRISLDSLNIQEKELFLDIACFFVGTSKNFTIQVLEYSIPCLENGFRRLKDLCLLNCGLRDVIIMHDILKQMGREIVRQENNDLGKRSRLWDYEDAHKVLENCEGTQAIEGLILLSPNKKDIKVKAKAFQQMTRLRVLHLDHVLLSPGNKLLFRNSGYKDLFGNLVWLRWHHCGLNVLPSELCLENLVALDLSCNNIKAVWRGPKVLSKLKFLNLAFCENLTTTPDFSGLPNLEELNLCGCKRLREVHKSIGHLDKLNQLNVAECRRLRKLLPEIDANQDRKVLSGLKFLDLFGLNLTTSPNFSWVPNLEELNLDGCERLREVHKSIGHLHKLHALSLCKGNNLVKLPLEMSNLKSLEKLEIYGVTSQCQTLTKKSTGSFGLSLNFLDGLRCLKLLEIESCSLIQLPDEIGSLISLTKLSISNSKFSCLPESICNLTKLKELRIENCGVSNLPSELGRLNQLNYLVLEGNNFCSLPESVGDLRELGFLSLRGCERLQSLPQLGGGGRKTSVDFSDCPSLRRISLESITNYEWATYFNCPELDQEYFAHKFGAGFLNYKVARSFRIRHSGDMFPNWLQSGTTNSYYALRVPALGVRNKHFIRCIFYVACRVEDSRYHFGLIPNINYQLYNKAKNIRIYFLSLIDSRFFGDQIVFHYKSFHVDELDLEEGDEIKISLTHNERVVLKK